MPRPRLELAGKRFGQMTVERDVGANQYGARLWQCRCACGNVVRATAGELRRRKSCGCATLVRTHGAAARNARFAREYGVWEGMKARCYNRRHKRYADWGGRGISVCPRWRHSFANFLRDMGPCPAGRSLHRIKNNRNYTPKNCVWATAREQAANRRPLKLNRSTIKHIRVALARGERQVDIAARYGIAQAHVSAIKLYKCHKKPATLPWVCP